MKNSARPGRPLYPAGPRLLQISRSLIVLTFCIGSLALVLAAEQPAAASPPPNIVLIMADDLGVGDLGCYGQQRIRTPRIDRMAAEGTRFTQAYAGSCVCAPSRCVLMTGLHNGHGRIRDNLPLGVNLLPDDETVAEVLKRAGYRTGVIGKWGLGDPGSFGVPNRQGFDDFYGHLTHNHAHFYYPQELWENETTVLLRGNRGSKKDDYTQDLFTKKALEFLEQNKDRPFFLYLPYTTPHWSDYDKKTPESQLVPSDAPYTNENWPQIEKNYAAMVTRLDGDVGKILDQLQRLGIERNTFVFFTSDNGPSGEGSHAVEFFNSNRTLRGAKRQVYEGGIRVPLIVRRPGTVAAGRVSDQIWTFWDYLPTLAELAGLPPLKAIDGISLAPTMLGRQQPTQHEYLYWDYGHTREQYMQGARFGDWKAVRNGKDAAIELYDLAHDPGETKDLAQEHRDVVEQAAQILKDARKPSAAYRIP